RSRSPSPWRYRAARCGRCGAQGSIAERGTALSLPRGRHRLARPFGFCAHSLRVAQRTSVRRHRLMPQEFYRIRRLPPYVFAEVNAMKAAARAHGEDVIALGMGNPDAAPPPHVIDKLTETVRIPRVHGYSSSRGIPGLRKAYAAYYARRFNVTLDPES